MVAIRTYKERAKKGGKQAITWVLVMDSRRAQIFTQDPEAVGPMLIPVITEPMQADPVEREMGRQALPRVFASTGKMRHAIEPHIDPTRESRKRFVHQVVGRLHEALEKKQFEQLIVVAPKKVIGELRPSLDGVGDKVIAEVPKDLTRVPLRALAVYLSENNLLRGPIGAA